MAVSDIVTDSQISSNHLDVYQIPGRHPTEGRREIRPATKGPSRGTGGALGRLGSGHGKGTLSRRVRYHSVTFGVLGFRERLISFLVCGGLRRVMTNEQQKAGGVHKALCCVSLLMLRSRGKPVSVYCYYYFIMIMIIIIIIIIISYGFSLDVACGIRMWPDNCSFL